MDALGPHVEDDLQRVAPAGGQVGDDPRRVGDLLDAAARRPRGAHVDVFGTGPLERDVRRRSRTRDCP